MSKPNFSDNIKEVAEKSRKKTKRRKNKIKPKMKISGASVKNLEKIVRGK